LKCRFETTGHLEEEMAGLQAKKMKARKGGEWRRCMNLRDSYKRSGFPAAAQTAKQKQ